MSESVSEMFGYERKSDNKTIIDNYDDFSCDISLPSDVTLDSDSDSHSEGVMSNKQYFLNTCSLITQLYLCYFTSHEVIPTITCNIVPKNNKGINNDCLSSTFSYLTKHSKPQKISPDIIELEPYLFLHYVTENILQLYFAYINDEMLIVFSEKNVYIDIYIKKKNFHI